MSPPQERYIEPITGDSGEPPDENVYNYIDPKDIQEMATPSGDMGIHGCKPVYRKNSEIQPIKAQTEEPSCDDYTYVNDGDDELSTRQISGDKPTNHKESSVDPTNYIEPVPRKCVESNDIYSYVTME